MSYDIKIWSRIKIQNVDPFIIKNYTILMDDSVTVENEDIPSGLKLLLSDIEYLTEFHLTPYTDNKLIIDRFRLYTNKIAKDFVGILEDPQFTEDTPVESKKIHRNDEKVTVTWHMKPDFKITDLMEDFIDLLSKYVPHALPRRYGSYEPPQYKFAETGKDHLLSFLQKEEHPVWYATKPITEIRISDSYSDNKKHPNTIQEFHSNRIELEIFEEAYNKPNWNYAIKQLFCEVSKLYHPFYAEISRGKESQICSWWWRGIPQKMGETVIIGQPYFDLIPGCSEFGYEIIKDMVCIENSRECKIPEYLKSKRKIFLFKKDKDCFKDNYRFAKIFPFKVLKT